MKTVLPQSLLDLYRSLRQPIARAALRFRPYQKLSPVQLYFRDGHNDLITANLGLNSASVVLDFGGYLGDYAAAISNRYQSQIHVFEPVPQFFAVLEDRFADQANITIHRYGIAGSHRVRTFGESADGTGAFAEGTGINVQFRSAEYLAELMPHSIDLIAVNIEGGEYELIPALDHVGLLARANRLFIQFHRVGSDPTGHRESCRRILESTHVCMWSYDFVWEAWVTKATSE